MSDVVFSKWIIRTFLVRKRDLKDRQYQSQHVKSKIRDKRLQSARCRKYYEDYQIRMRSKMLKKRTKEELVSLITVHWYICRFDFVKLLPITNVVRGKGMFSLVCVILFREGGGGGPDCQPLDPSPFSQYVVPPPHTQIGNTTLSEVFLVTVPASSARGTI